MSITVYEFRSYKEYLNAWLEAQPKAGHGLRRKMAEVIGTQTGFITQVLSGSAHFSPEQVFSLSEMLGLGPEESQFLQLILQLERAGSVDYRRHVEKQIAKILDERKKLSQRLKSQDFPSDLDQSRYFSSWFYACLHVMTTCERFQASQAAMAESLGMPLAIISEAVEFLIHAGLIKEEKGRLVSGHARVHLGTDSPFLINHHRNWNLLALQKMSTDLRKDLHYSSVTTMSRKDLEVVKEIFMRAIEDSKKIVRVSEGEKVCVTTLNFFEIA